MALTDMQIAKIILEQLGGNKFIAMTGAKNFVAKDATLYFALAKKVNDISHVSITLDVNDTYLMNFTRNRLVKKNGISSPETIIVHTISNVYADQLQSIFTDQTGLATRL